MTPGAPLPNLPGAGAILPYGQPKLVGFVVLSLLLASAFSSPGRKRLYFPSTGSSCAA
ncbi:MAG: hypothetical protein U0527_15810 [Candidatus Eisenbacteria bacterium]